MTSRRYRVGVDVLAIVVAMSVAFALADTTWRVLGYAGAVVREVPTVADRPATPPVDIQPILALAPFGSAVAAEDADASAAGDLVLRGIIRARTEAASVAFIAAGAAEPRPYSIGARLPSGAVVTAIGIETVSLSAAGGNTVLAFPRPEAPGAAAGVSRMRALLAPEVAGAAPANGGISTPSALQTVREKVADNPQAFLQSLGASASSQGYIVGPGASQSVRQAGLIPGDVIEKVNGQPVGDLDNDRRLFDGALIAGRVRLDVLRDGRRLSLSFPLR